MKHKVSRVWSLILAVTMAVGMTVMMPEVINGSVEKSTAEGYTSGWHKNSTGWWYQYPDGSYPKSQWEMINSNWYHFDEKGYMQTGWILDSGKWYYLNAYGAMETGWVQDSGKWYYLNVYGVMQTGWQYLNGYWYYFSSGGAMQTGWQNLNGNTYYFHPGGIMVAAAYINGWWLNADGRWTYPYQATWRKNSIGWWYGDESGWYARSVTYNIDGQDYTFDRNGFTGGETYIDVNIPEQMIRYYVNGEVVFSSPCVTGQRGSSDTPTGIFEILDMDGVEKRGRPVILTPSDGTKWKVSYWMGYDPETGGNMYALHDASWRDGVFGGDIYTYDGSHGCVNMPVEKAAELYSLIDYGTKLYIH